MAGLWAWMASTALASIVGKSLSEFGAPDVLAIGVATVCFLSPLWAYSK